jgi:hypothetical protein
MIIQSFNSTIILIILMSFNRGFLRRGMSCRDHISRRCWGLISIVRLARKMERNRDFRGIINVLATIGLQWRSGGIFKVDMILMFRLRPRRNIRFWTHRRECRSLGKREGWEIRGKGEVERCRSWIKNLRKVRKMMKLIVLG